MLVTVMTSVYSKCKRAYVEDDVTLWAGGGGMCREQPENGLV
jgi:hypothetical protein